ncbi:MAG: FAD-binding oxidoreductase [Candidatus Pacearchaeota archaeon]|nr:FAD-binding oxidoreductase [Candidatus Pacearchaeota archaeon]
MTNEYIVKILKTGFVTHNVKSFVFEKPEGYKFISGQATDTSINTNEFKNEKRPFTFTSKNTDLVLEFTMKRYDGMTKKFHELNPGDEIIIREPFGTINYKDEGVFIAGGAGITPFLSIFRNIGQEAAGKSKLIFSNKTHKDIICERELKEIFQDNAILLLTEEKRKEYIHKKINKTFMKNEIKDFDKYFYICGPTSFVDDIKKYLIKLDVKKEKIIVEE